MATNSNNNGISVSNKGQTMEEMLAELAQLRQERDALVAKNTKVTQVFPDPKGSGRIVVTGCGRGGRTMLTPKAAQILANHAAEILACAKAHPELEAQYVAFTATFADDDSKK